MNAVRVKRSAVLRSCHAWLYPTCRTLISSAWRVGFHPVTQSAPRDLVRVLCLLRVTSMASFECGIHGPDIRGPDIHGPDNLENRHHASPPDPDNRLGRAFPCSLPCSRNCCSSQSVRPSYSRGGTFRRIAGHPFRILGCILGCNRLLSSCHRGHLASCRIAWGPGLCLACGTGGPIATRRARYVCRPTAVGSCPCRDICCPGTRPTARRDTCLPCSFCPVGAIVIATAIAKTCPSESGTGSPWRPVILTSTSPSEICSRMSTWHGRSSSCREKLTTLTSSTSSGPLAIFGMGTEI